MVEEYKISEIKSELEDEYEIKLEEEKEFLKFESEEKISSLENEISSLRNELNKIKNTKPSSLRVDVNKSLPYDDDIWEIRTRFSLRDLCHTRRGMDVFLQNIMSEIGMKLEYELRDILGRL